jgi:O-antigen/teichoic acid export membrane protein
VRHLSISAATLAAAQVGGQIIGLAMLVIVSRQIGPTYLGAYAVSYNIVAYVGLATTIGLPVIGMRDVSGADADRRNVLVETATTRVLLSLFFGAALIAIAPWITSSHATQVLLSILALKLITEALTFDWYLQGRNRHSVVAASRFIGQVAYAVVLIPLLAGGLRGARHYAIANIAGLAVTAGIMIALVVQDVGLPFGKVSFTQLRQRVRRSTPFLWWIALTQVYYSTDLILVGYFAGNHQAGLYAAASKLPLSVIAVASLWFAVSMPETARLHSIEGTTAIRRQTRVASTTAVVVGVPFVLLGPLFATDISTTIFGPKFAGSGPALAILSASVAISLLQIVVTSVVMGAGRERSYVRVMAIGAAANVVLNLILIPTLGIVGAAISTIAAESIVLIAGIGQISHVIGRMDVRWRSVGEAAITTGVAGGIALLVRQEVGFFAASLSAIAVYTLTITVRTMRGPHWLNAWLGNVS